MRLDPSFVSQMSVGVLLIKLVGFSIVCPLLISLISRLHQSLVVFLRN